MSVNVPRNPLVVGLLVLGVLAPARASFGAETAPADTVAVAVDAQVVDLGGVWNLDESASDDLDALVEQIEQAMRDARRSRDLQGGQGGHGSRSGRGMGSMGGTGNRPPPQDGNRGGSRSDRDPEGGAGLLGDLAQSLRQLLVIQTVETVEIMDGAGRNQVFVTDGRSRSVDRGRAEVTQRASWIGGALTIEDRGGPLTLTRVLRLGEDGGILHVEVKVTQGEMTGRADLVYRGAR